MNNNSTATDRCILLGFLALTTVGVVQGNVEKHNRDFIEPHELPHRYHDDRDYGKHKLDQYRHKVWGEFLAVTNKRKLPREANAQLQDDLLVMLRQQIRGGAINTGDTTALLQNLEDHLDSSDNEAQVRVLQHHYMNEFGHHISASEVLKDYSENCVLHLVVNNVPRTLSGRDGARRAFLDLFGLVPHDMSHSLEFEHVAIDHNHAQVVWKANVSSSKVMRGIDSFAFDEHNHIVHQSVMAVLIPSDATQTDL